MARGLLSAPGMPAREDYLLHGAQDLADADLIALILGTGVTGHSARGIASAMIDQFGSPLALAQAPPGALARVRGVGNARAVRLHAALQLGLRAGRHPLTPEHPILDPEQAAAVLLPRFHGLVSEEIHALYLDRRSRPLSIRRLSAGTDSYAVLDPRQVLRPAVQLGATHVVLAHNHPSGDPEPSAEDLVLTERVARAARTLDVFLVDHLVIAGARFTSLRRLGRMA